MFSKKMDMYLIWLIFGLLGGQRFYFGRYFTGMCQIALFVVGVNLENAIIGDSILLVLVIWWIRDFIDLRKLLSISTDLLTSDEVSSDERKCESPIEVKMYRALINAGIRGVPQFPVGRYRIDLAVLTNGKRIAIECDGKDFHSSPKQKAHDAKKDGVLRAKGWVVIRFTGSEIHRYPRRCAWKIRNMI